ncbi:MAG: SUF system FeS assembly protein, NifU family [Candidatus Roizmanbacteria bacterium GW2011_GWA2_36_23]|uniref:SUF system FeS assembly protein, NifU family n=1 Tax=Candidatus Roizmanbacteria bacterium GW2011_GWA2_36_23 TaxID=1618480 RepID=A0A0G0E8N9_9BACT|nr:MAG: SUF system FeS assembly protein, NifU family [Candidatus Roizmanbacteria bacterium GW2011_GWA2_36_23]
MTLYQEIILDHFRNPKNKRKLSNPSKKATVINSLCGDKIVMEVEYKKNRVENIGFKGEGCAISQALTSILTEYAKGKTKEQLKKIDKDFMIKLLGIDLGPNRLKCALLPLEALRKLI